MTDSLKFGPEWLRMSSGGGGSGSGSSSATAAAATTMNNSAPRYPLSEFRYGREEMLALFDKNMKHPEILPRYKHLFVEKVQCPLALTPSAEDDQAARMWPMRSSPGLSVRGGRGGIMDRGRGRGRGAYHSVSGFSRSSLFPEEESGRVMGRGERWTERNGTDPGEWASGLPSTSPRKEYSSHGRGVSIESWRRPRGEDDASDQWRSGSLGPREPPKWGRSTSWREEDPGMDPRGGYNDRGYTNSGMEQRPGGTRSMSRRPWDMHEDNLPEWAVDHPLESGGSFDATGAFHGSDDELSPESAARYKQNVRSHRNKELVNGGSGSANEDEEQRPTRTRTHEANDKGAGTNPDQVATNGPRSAGGESAQADAAAASGSPSNQAAQSPELEAEEAKAAPPQAANVDRMQEVADDMVEKLIMDTDEEEKEKPGKMGGAQEEAKMNAGPGGIMGAPKGPPALVSVNETEWFYRDPQDMVQGPFSAVEMAEWYQAGYFDNNLYVRRKNDQRFSKLGELIEMCGGEMPFFVPYRPLSMQMSGPSPVDQQGPMKGPPILPHRLQPGMMDLDPNMDPRVLRQNYLASQQAIYQKLSSSDMWHMLSPEQQRQMVRKHVAQLPVPDSIFGVQSAGDAAANILTPFGLFDMMNKAPPSLEDMGGVVDNSILQQNILAAKKLQHQRLLAAGGPGGVPGGPGQPLIPMMPPLPQDFPPVLNPVDPLNQLMHNIRLGAFPQGQPSMVPPQQQQQQQPGGSSAAENDRIKSLLLQLSMQKGMQPQPGSAAALSQMMMNQLQQAHLQKPGMGPWPFAGGDPLKNPGQPLNMMGPGGAAGGGNSWMGLEGGPPQPNGPLGDMGRPGMPGNNGGGGGIWELEHKLFSNNGTGKPIEMKTEKQIIEEQQLAAAAQLQKDKENELMHEEQGLQQQQLEVLPSTTGQGPSLPHAPSLGLKERGREQHQQMQSNDTSDNKGWTKVESKATVGRVDANQKKGADADKNAKKKEAPAKPGQQQQQGAKKEDPAKKSQAAQEVARQQQQQQQQQQQKDKQKGKVASSPPSNHNHKSVAPWSINQPQQETGLTLAEIQKLEMEQQRAEQARMDQAMQQQQQQQWFDIQNLKADLPKWNAPQIAPSVVKSLAEIQAEEQAKLRQWQESTAAATAAANQQAAAAAAAAKKVVEEAPGAVWGSVKVWSSNGVHQQSSSSLGGFWEEPVKSSSSSHAQTMAGTVARAAAAGGKTIAKSQTMSAIQTKGSSSSGANNAKASSAGSNKGNAGQNNKQGGGGAATSGSVTTNGNASGKKEGKGGKGKKDDASGQEFTQWCTKALSAYNSTIDIPTFVSFLQDIESPYEVKDYIRVYLGETKECTDFCKQFLERRSKYKNQIRAQNAHVDDMCSPAPALTPSSDFQEGKAKKVKKNKMMKLDSRILGFSVTAAQDRINVGDRDYPNAS